MNTQAETPMVEIVPNKKGGAVITAYKNKPEFGFIQMRSEAMTAENGWLRTSKRSTLLRARVDELKAFITNFVKDGKAAGIIHIIEVTESELDTPEFSDLVKRLDKNKSREEAIQSFIKKAGSDKDDAPELVKDGERILKFSAYIMQPQAHHVDRFVQHTNTEEVAKWRLERDLKKANTDAQLEGANKVGK